MEKLLRKSAIYGFFVGIGAGILLVKYRQVEHFNAGPSRQMGRFAYSGDYRPAFAHCQPILPSESLT